VPAVAAGLAAVVAIVVAAAISGGGDDEPLPPIGNTTVPITTPTTVSAPETAGEVGEALNAAAAAGDWETVVGLFAVDATVTLGPGNAEFEGSSNPRASNTGFGPTNPTNLGDFLTGNDWLGSFPVVDWDGDSSRSGLDSVAQDTMIGWAMGFSVFESCQAEDTSTLVCVGLWDEHPFPNPGRGEEIAIHTVVDGLITDTTWDIEGVTGNISVIDRIEANEYAAWVEANRTEFTADAELFQTTAGDPITALVMTPDTVGIHRQLIAEWVAQR
jgi:hypothetical protein